MTKIVIPFSEYINPGCIQGKEGLHYCFNDELALYETYDEGHCQFAKIRAVCRGLHYDNIRGGKTPVPSLVFNNFIPMVPRGSRKLFTDYPPPVIGVGLNDILTKDGSRIRKDFKTGYPSGSKIIVFFYGFDPLLENFWANHRRVIRELAGQQIFAATAPNFSVWENQHFREQDINLKRSLIIYDFMHDCGISAIPHFYWKRACTGDIVRTARWLNKRPNIATVALDFQTFSEHRLWAEVIGEFNELLSLLNRRIHFLISGPQELNRVKEIVRATNGNVTFVSGQPAVLASNRRGLENSPSGLKKIYFGSNKQSTVGQTQLFDIGSRTEKSPGEIFKQNCEAQKKQIDDCLAVSLLDEVHQVIRAYELPTILGLKRVTMSKARAPVDCQPTRL